MDWDKARFLMVEQQIRPWDVNDDTVLQLLLELKREEFVPVAYRELALVDMEIPLGRCGHMWHPKLEARVAQELRLTGNESVLEIGTGAGYFTALLARLAKQVYSVELEAGLVAHAQTKLKACGINNALVEQGDAASGWSKNAPYDVIVATGSYPAAPEFLFDQLSEGGRLFAVVGDAPAMQATLFTKQDGKVDSRVLFETVISQLQNAPQPERFRF